jgi:RHH-type rel operon transcriptional repressor/antitoxin RelB
MIAVRLPGELEMELQTIAAKTGRTKSYYVIEALRRYLEDMQDRFVLEGALKEFYEGDQKTYTSQQVAAELGITL